MKSILILFLVLVAFFTRAGEDTDVMYVNLTRGLVINFGEPSLSRLRYLKVAVDVRVENGEDAELIEYHLAALQDALVISFSTIDEDYILSHEGREEIRLLALDSVNKVIEAEEGDPIILDLLFSSFIVQR